MIKIITDKDFKLFHSLYIQMLKSIHPEITESRASIKLSEDMCQPGFVAIGKYKEDKLIGFACGYMLDVDTFFGSGFYCEIPLYAQRLISSLEVELKQIGYTKWEVDVFKTKTIIPKLGAKVKYVRYVKEI